MRTRFADDFVRECASKVVLDGLFLRGALDRGLQLIEELVHILLNIFLLNNVHWLSIIIFVAVAEGFRVHVLLL